MIPLITPELYIDNTLELKRRRRGREREEDRGRKRETEKGTERETEEE